MNLSRRKWLARAALYGGSIAPFAYGSVIEKRWLRVTHQDIPLPQAHRHLDGLTVAVMGDFHHDDFGDNRLIQRAVKTVNESGVDIVMLVGDYISSDHGGMQPLCDELRHLRPRIGSFAVLGNHDCWHLNRDFPNFFTEAGIRLLVNEAVEFDDFAVVGIDSVWGGAPDLRTAFAPIPDGKPVILGWHEPDTFDSYNKPEALLQVSGHTHGGQICAPFYGPILLPDHGKNYPYGHYEKEGRSLFVTRGIGTLTIPARFLCAPELAILTLRDLAVSEGQA